MQLLLSDKGTKGFSRQGENTAKKAVRREAVNYIGDSSLDATTIKLTFSCVCECWIFGRYKKITRFGRWTVNALDTVPLLSQLSYINHHHGQILFFSHPPSHLMASNKQYPCCSSRSARNVRKLGHARRVRNQSQLYVGQLRFGL